MRLGDLEEQVKLEQNHWWFRARRRIVGAIVREIVPPSRNALIVDVGCGVGVGAQSFATEYEVVGIDECAEAIAVAKSCFPDTLFVCGEAPHELRALMLRARLVLVTDTLEHSADDRELFQLLFDAARPGTFFVLTVPTAFALWSAREPRIKRFRRYNAADLVRVWGGLPIEELLFAFVDWRLHTLLRLPFATTVMGLTPFRDQDALPTVPPNIINRFLENRLFGEARALTQELRGTRRNGYRRGTTLMAVLRKVR
jgi:SAM-dependent methyltransferase